MKRFILALGLTLLVAAPALAADPTYSENVAPILRENCETCHRPVARNAGGMFAPMSLQTYDEVRPWAKSIAREVQARAMPPWFATEHTSGLFHDERVLSEEQIATVVAWAKAGAPAGDLAKQPAPATFTEDSTNGWTVGKPDLIVPMPEPYTVADDVDDLNINFSTTLTAEQLPEDTWIQGIEFRVGGPNVHHMCASAYGPGEAQSFSPGKGFSRNGLGCIALGAEPTFLPEGYAQLLKAGSTHRVLPALQQRSRPWHRFHRSVGAGLLFRQGAGSVTRPSTMPSATLSFEIPPQRRSTGRSVPRRSSKRTPI